MDAELVIAIAGAGRMGQAIAAIIERADDLRLAGIWRRGEDAGPLVRAADVVIDFSLPSGTDTVVDAVRAAGKPLVCGVTGLDDNQLERLETLAQAVAVVYDRNMSRGIAVLDAALRHVAGALPPEFRAEVSEVHHVHKKDSPSGTAIKLAETLAAARGIERDSIPVASERRGEVPGDHEVRFRSGSECLVLSHSVTSRTVFADGAVAAARWAARQAPGRYSMRDVLFGR